MLVAAALVCACVGPACAQTAQDFDELRLELRRLRDEVTELKRNQPRQASAPSAVAPKAVDASASAIASPSQQPGNPRRTVPRVSAIPGGMLVPGTDTSVHLYGDIEGHAIHDLKSSGPSDNFTDLAFQPLDNSGAQRGRTKLTAETSRLGFETSTPAAGGELKTKLEMDFYAYGSGNRNRLRLRQAYGEYGGWLIGQTWSTFMDLDDLPETVDFNGPVGAPFSRRMMVRYSYADAKAGYKLTAALEDPQDQAQLGAINSANERLPGLVLRYDQTLAWGAVNLRALTHEKRSASSSRRGYGLAVGGNYKLSDKDLLMAQYTRVDGDADQLYGSNGYAIAADGAISFDQNQGLVLGYARAFNPRLRGTVALGLNKAKSVAAVDNRRLQELFVNLIYSPLDGVEFGAEYIHGKRRSFAGETGTLSRFDLMARYSF
ncbi:porin [Pelomonas sp. HMWF004]|nr:porin [Pelomonas sp. HMWF004]